MKTVTINLYQYDELSEKAKEKARRWYLEGFDFDSEWDCIKEDAKNIGLELTAWMYMSHVKGSFITSAPEVAESILANHGEICETYKTAKAYLKSIKHLYNLTSDEMTTEQEQEKEDKDSDFLEDILKDYRVMADKEYEYVQSEEAIEETMKANEYEFLENGERFQI